MEADSFLHEQEQEALTFKGETAGISALPFITLLDGLSVWQTAFS